MFRIYCIRISGYKGGGDNVILGMSSALLYIINFTTPPPSYRDKRVIPIMTWASYGAGCAQPYALFPLCTTAIQYTIYRGFFFYPVGVSPLQVEKSLVITGV